MEILSTLILCILSILSCFICFSIGYSELVDHNKISFERKLKKDTMDLLISQNDFAHVRNDIQSGLRLFEPQDRVKTPFNNQMMNSYLNEQKKRFARKFILEIQDSDLIDVSENENNEIIIKKITDRDFDALKLTPEYDSYEDIDKENSGYQTLRTFKKCQSKFDFSKFISNLTESLHEVPSEPEHLKKFTPRIIKNRSLKLAKEIENLSTFTYVDYLDGLMQTYEVTLPILERKIRKKSTKTTLYSKYIDILHFIKNFQENDHPYFVSFHFSTILRQFKLEISYKEKISKCLLRSLYDPFNCSPSNDNIIFQCLIDITDQPFHLGTHEPRERIRKVKSIKYTNKLEFLSNYFNSLIDICLFFEPKIEPLSSHHFIHVDLYIKQKIKKYSKRAHIMTQNYLDEKLEFLKMKCDQLVSMMLDSHLEISDKIIFEALKDLERIIVTNPHLFVKTLNEILSLAKFVQKFFVSIFLTEKLEIPYDFDNDVFSFMDFKKAVLRNFFLETNKKISDQLFGLSVNVVRYFSGLSNSLGSEDELNLEDFIITKHDFKRQLFDMHQEKGYEMSDIKALIKFSCSPSENDNLGDPDEILDFLLIFDTLLKKFMNLNNIDFESSLLLKNDLCDFILESSP